MGLLLADVAIHIPVSPKFDGHRDQFTRRLVSWLECCHAARQLVARYTVNEMCDWWCHSVPPNAFLTMGPKQVAEALTGARRSKDGALGINSVLEAVNTTWDDPWHRLQRGSAVDLAAEQREFAYIDHRWSIDLEASMLTSVARYSLDETARAKALWNLGCLAATNLSLAEKAYNAFHGCRHDGASESIARSLLRGSLSGFLQDYGPVNGVDDRWFEMAEANIRAIRANDGWCYDLKLCLWYRTRVPWNYCKYALDEFFHTVLADRRLARDMANARLDQPSALSYIMTMLDHTLVDEHRRQREVLYPDPAQIPIETTNDSSINSHPQDDAKIANRIDEVRRRADRVDATRRGALAGEILNEGLNRLTDLEAATLFYRRIREYSRQEAATILRITENSLDHLVEKALQSLWEILHDDFPSDLNDLFSLGGDV